MVAELIVPAAEVDYANYLAYTYPNDVNGNQSQYLSRALRRVQLSPWRVDRWIEDFLDRPPVRKDIDAERRFQSAEMMSNDMSRYIMSMPEAVDRESQPLDEVFETNIDHGISHIRRVEKWYKKAQAEDLSTRLEPGYQFFSLSAFAAVRNHDIVYLASGIKGNHAEAAALFMLCFMLDNYHQLATSPDGKMRIRREQWDKLAWVTAFIIAHHSSPENIPSDIDALQTGGIVNPGVLFDKVRETAAANHLAVEEYFPLFSQGADSLAKVENDDLSPPTFTDGEVDGIIKQAKRMAVADKLDTTLPPELVVNRTFETIPTRPFFTPLSDYYFIDTATDDEVVSAFKQVQEEPHWRQDLEAVTTKECGNHFALKHYAQELFSEVIDPDCMTPEEIIQYEIRVRVRLATFGIAHCDVDRLLLELDRTQTFQDISPYLSRVAEGGQLRKAVFLKAATAAFVEGDIDKFTAEFGEQRRHDIAEFKKKVATRGKSGPGVLKAIQSCVVPLEDEEDNIRRILTNKYAMMTAHSLMSTASHTLLIDDRFTGLGRQINRTWQNHIGALFDQMLKKVTREKTIPYQIEPPYTTYSPPSREFLCLLNDD